MKKLSKFSLGMSVFALLLTACSTAPKKDTASNAPKKETTATSEAKTVKIKDIDGEVEVPVNPQRVVALDNRTFKTLEDWGVKPVAVPKKVMAAGDKYAEDSSIQDIGNHKEPNLEIIAAANPDLVIVGQRFGKYTNDIKKLVPNAKVINLNFDVSGKKGNSGKSLIEGLKSSTESLGKIFGKETEANKLIADLDASIEKVKSSYKKDQSVMGIVVSGGKIGYSAPITGRVWGPLFEVFSFKPALTVTDSSSNHKGDDISVEAIAQSNPEWMLVLDRDAAIASAKDAQKATDVIKNAPALANTSAIKNSHVIYAPADTYTNESIQTFITIFTELASAFSK